MRRREPSNSEQNFIVARAWWSPAPNARSERRRAAGCRSASCATGSARLRNATRPPANAALPGRSRLRTVSVQPLSVSAFRCVSACTLNCAALSAFRSLTKLAIAGSGCKLCVVGKESRDGAPCVFCPAGRFTDVVGTGANVTRCMMCEGVKDSYVGASKCDLCAAGSYATQPRANTSSECVKCRDIDVNPKEEKAPWIKEPPIIDPNFCLGGSLIPPWDRSKDPDGTCRTTGGSAAEGSECLFPFNFSGTTYNECTHKGHNRAWCFTAQTSGLGSQESTTWGNCVCKDTQVRLSLWTHCLSPPFLVVSLPFTALLFGFTAFHRPSMWIHCLSPPFFVGSLPFTALPCGFSAAHPGRGCFYVVLRWRSVFSLFSSLSSVLSSRWFVADPRVERP